MWCPCILSKRLYNKTKFNNKLRWKDCELGGYVITKSKSPKPIPSIIASILSSPFGAGNSRFRTLVWQQNQWRKVIETDTVPLGVLKKYSVKLVISWEEPGNEDRKWTKEL